MLQSMWLQRLSDWTTTTMVTLLRWSNKRLFFFFFGYEFCWLRASVLKKMPEVKGSDGPPGASPTVDMRPQWSPLLSGQLSLNILIQKGKGVSGKGVSRPSYAPPFCASKLESGSGAWWAAVYGVAQRQTRLKRLSSSSFTALDYAYSLRSCLLQRILKTCEVFCGREECPD